MEAEGETGIFVDNGPIHDDIPASDVDTGSEASSVAGIDFNI